MIVGELERRLDEAVPYAWAEEWDNVGLLLGDRSEAVRGGIAITLDLSLEAMTLALERSCSVLITHHPFLFHPMKRIDCSKGVGALAAFAIRHGLSIFALHTNWDASPRGVNAVIARALGLQEMCPIVSSTSGAWGSGAFGKLPCPRSFKECGVMVRDALCLSRLELYGETERDLSVLALCGGSGGNLWRAALTCGADAYCTADMKYHERLDALEGGMPLLLADHGEMERFSLTALAETVSEATDNDAVVLEPPLPKVHVI